MTAGSTHRIAIDTQANHTPSFEDVYREHVRFVWRTVRRLGVMPADVEDVCQLVFEVVHRQLASFRGDSRISTWIFQIVYRTVRDHKRSAYHRRRIDAGEIDVAIEPEQEDVIERSQARALLDDLLAELDDDKRATFVLCEVEGLEVKEVAELMGCPVQTVYSRLRVARDRIEQAARRRMLLRRQA